MTRRVLESAEKLQAVACFCIGTNQVDLECAAERGIAVFNSPYSNTRSVAELVIAEVVFIMRGIHEKSVKAHQGTWLKIAKNAFEVRGKKLGIIGYGHIGAQVSVLAEAMGMKVLYYDVVPKLPMGNAQSVSTRTPKFGQKLGAGKAPQKARLGRHGEEQSGDAADGRKAPLLNANRLRNGFELAKRRQQRRLHWLNVLHT